MNRRDLLKWFGAGATIAPILAGVASEEARAIIVKPPEVELAPPPKIIEVTDARALMGLEKYDVTVFMRGQESGKVFRIDCQAFAVHIRHEIIDVTTHSTAAPWRDLYPGATETTLQVTGPIRMVEPRSRR